MSFIGILIVVSILALVTKWLLYRSSEKSFPFNRYTTSEEAINAVNLTGKLAIVTGANSGMGKETVRVLVKQGCKVVMACRNEKKANAAKDEICKALNLSNERSESHVIVMKLDLSSLESVKQFAEEFNKQNLKINYLINNAGIMALPKYSTSKDGFEAQFATNLLGHFYLTNLLMPSLLRSDGKEELPRVICVSSTAQNWFDDYDYTLNLFNDCIKNKDFMGDRSKEYDPWIIYDISKACDTLFARELQKRFDNKLIAVSLHPGVVNTELSRNLDLQTTLSMMKILARDPLFPMKHAKSIPQGAATTLRCVSLPESEIKKGHYYMNCRSAIDSGELGGVARIDLDEKNGLLAQKLWELSEVLIKSKGFSLE